MIINKYSEFPFIRTRIGPTISGLNSESVLMTRSLHCETHLLYTNIDQKLVSSLHGLLNCEISGLNCRVITTEYRTRVHCIHIYHLICNAFVRQCLVNVRIQYTEMSCLGPSNVSIKL